MRRGLAAMSRFVTLARFVPAVALDALLDLYLAVPRTLIPE